MDCCSSNSWLPRSLCEDLPFSRSLIRLTTCTSAAMIDSLSINNSSHRRHRLYFTRRPCGNRCKTSLTAVLWFVIVSAHVLKGMEKAAQDVSSASIGLRLGKSAEKPLSSPEIAPMTAADIGDTQHGVENPAKQVLTHSDFFNTHAYQSKQQQTSRLQTEYEQEATQFLETSQMQNPDGSNASISKLQTCKVARSRDHEPSGSHRELQDDFGDGLNPTTTSRLDIITSNEALQGFSFQRLWKNARGEALSSKTFDFSPQLQRKYLTNPTESQPGPRILHAGISKEKFAELQRFPKSDPCEVPSAEKIWLDARPGELSIVGSGSSAKEMGAELESQAEDFIRLECDLISGKERAARVENPTKSGGSSAPSAKQLWKNAQARRFSLWSSGNKEGELNSQTTKQMSMPPDKKRKSTFWPQSGFQLTGAKPFHDIPGTQSGDFLFRGRTILQKELTAQPSGGKTPEPGSQSCNMVILGENDDKLTNEETSHNHEAPSSDNPCTNEKAKSKKLLSSGPSEECQAQTDWLCSVPQTKKSKYKSKTILTRRKAIETYYRTLHEKLYQSTRGMNDPAVGVLMPSLPEDVSEKPAESGGTGTSSMKPWEKYGICWIISVDRGSLEADRLELKRPIEEFVEDLLRRFYAVRLTPSPDALQRHQNWLIQAAYSLLFDVKVVWRAFPLIASNKQIILDDLQKEAWELYKAAWEAFYRVRKVNGGPWKIQKNMTTSDITQVMERARQYLLKGDKPRQFLGARGLLLIWLSEVSPILYENALVQGSRTSFQKSFSAVLNLFHQDEASRVDREKQSGP